MSYGYGSGDHSHSEYAPSDHYHYESDLHEVAGKYHDHDLSELWSFIHGLREDLSTAENRIAELEQQVGQLLQLTAPPTITEFCGCDHLHPDAASMCLICDLPIKDRQ